MNNTEIRSHFLHSLYNASLEILGAPEADRVFSTAIGWYGEGEPDKNVLESNFLSMINSEFSIKFHQNTAKGLLVRIGDAAFPFLKDRVEKLNDLGSIENRLKPYQNRFIGGVSVLAETLAEVLGMHIEIHTENDDAYCLDLPKDKPGFSSDLHLYMIGGVLRAFGTWMDSRRIYAFDMPETDYPDRISRVCLQINVAE